MNNRKWTLLECWYAANRSAVILAFEMVMVGAAFVLAAALPYMMLCSFFGIWP
jgi:hypothetical protein